MEIAEPMLMASSTDNSPVMRVTDCTLKVEPIRAKLLKLKLEPHRINPRTVTFEPNRPNERTDMLEPKLRKLHNDSL
jgi:hypothetical protein